MEAIVSGSARVAVLVDGARLRRVGLDSKSAGGEPCEAHDLPRLFGDARDLTFMEGVRADDVSRELAFAHSAVEALHLALLLCDPGTTNRTVGLVLDDLEGLFRDAEVVERVEYILEAQPMLSPLDPGVAVARARGHGRAVLTGFFEGLAARQDRIRAVRRAWDVLPATLFDGGGDRAMVTSALARAGLFRSLVRVVEQGDDVGAWLIGALVNPAVKRQAHHRELLQAWIEPFRVPTMRVPTVSSSTAAEADGGPQRPASAKKGAKATVDKQAWIEKQKAAIVAAMRARQEHKVRMFTKELVAQQLDSGPPRYAAMSLCALAAEAKRLALPRLQLELAEWSTRVNPNDSVCWIQYGDAAARLSDWTSALMAYDRAIVLDQSGVAISGRAHVLKRMGGLARALAAYDEAIERFPDNVVAKNGRAEVLKAMGRLPEALAAYAAAAKDHPEDVVAKTGRAEVLKAMGRLPEALAAYDAAAKDHPENVVAKTGRAEVLKAMGRLPEALAAYDAAAKDHPENVVAKNGRAEVLKAMGRLPEALAAYEAAAKDHPEDVVAKTGRAEVLKAMGRLPEALAAYDAAAKDHPENIVAKNGRAGVLMAMRRFTDVLQALPASHPPATREEWIGQHIRAMALLRLQRVAEAQNFLDAGATACPFHDVRRYFDHSLAVVALRERRYQRAVELATAASTVPSLRAAADVIQLHAYGALGDDAGVQRIVSSIVVPAAIADLVAELRQRYVDRKPPARTDQWLFEQEVTMLFAL